MRGKDGKKEEKKGTENIKENGKIIIERKEGMDQERCRWRREHKKNGKGNKKRREKREKN